MKKIIILSFLTVLLSACATGPKVEVLVDNFKGEEKEIVMLSNDYHLKKLRVELKKYGFKMPKFAFYAEETISETKNTDTGTSSHSVRGKRSTARYGIDVTSANEVDWCPGASGRKVNITLEITDIETNEVVAYITNGGWTERCVIYSGDLYQKLAKQINDLWKSKYKSIETEYDDEENE